MDNKTHNKALHWTMIPLRSIAAGEPCRSLVEMAIEKDEKTTLPWFKKQAETIDNHK